MNDIEKAKLIKEAHDLFDLLEIQIDALFKAARSSVKEAA